MVYCKAEVMEIRKNLQPAAGNAVGVWKNAVLLQTDIRNLTLSLVFALEKDGFGSQMLCECAGRES